MNSILNSGLVAHKKGDLALAESLYLQIPKDVNALQLLGTIYSAQGKLELAIEKMRQSIRMNTKQPHVYNNLGNCFKKLGDSKAAIKQFNEAVRQDPKYSDAYINLAITYQEMGDLVQVSQTISKALSLEPKSVKSLNVKAQNFVLSKKYDQAVLTYKQVLLVDAGNKIAIQGLTTGYKKQGDASSAIDLLIKLSKNKDLAAFSYALLGQLHYDNNQITKSIEAYKQCLEIELDTPVVHRDLNKLLYQADLPLDKPLESYIKLFESGSYTLESVNDYLQFKLKLDNSADALLFIESFPNSRVEESTPELQLKFMDTCAQIQRKNGRIKAALDIHSNLVESTSLAGYRISYAVTLLIDGKVEEAQRLLQQIVNDDPLNQMAVAYLGLCWRLMGDSKHRELNDYGSYIQEFYVQDFINDDQFGEKLRVYLNKIHTSSQSPVDQTLKGGTQTLGNLFDLPGEPLIVLEESFNSCIAQYIKELKSKKLPTFGIENAQGFKIDSSWSVKLNSEGFHTMHIHPMGRISSVFYVDLPSEVTNSSNRAGWLKFGEPDIAIGDEYKAEYFVKPEVGKLVLFPSFMWHGTIPFESDSPRLTVAFDVIPTSSRIYI